MYSLPLYFPSGTKVDPLGVMYSIDSYHDRGDNTPIHDVDPTKQLEKDQLNLIKLLGTLNDRLDKHLSGLKKETKEVEHKKKKVIDGVHSQDKKGDRKKGGTGIPLKETLISTIPWKMVEDKVGAEEKNGISACSNPSLTKYQQEKIGRITVTVTDHDLFWIESLAKIGSKRDIKFSGEMKNGITTKGMGEVEVKKGDSFSLEVDSLCSRDRVTAWKILGLVLGLFSFNHHFALQNAHSHRWLIRLNEVISEGKKEKEVLSLVSAISQFLSRFDSLSSHTHFSLSDVLIRRLFNGNLPNNVELWAKRLDSVQ
uniref:Uncharacterized protein n=1 Tax=Pristionchus pacificus TaxID=54126 RepID=A0A8R1Z9N2_PRIPA